jgi:DNA-binding winged helix-turn-helix (wHTH) protein/tetratricopeptide (TPR) repeat protein
MYSFSPFKLDATSQCLLLRQPSGKEVRMHLPPKAFSVLQYLVENAGRLVTHNELLDKVWPNTFVQPEVLSSHIRDVRAALGDDARKPRFIETLSRRGYRFIGKIEDGETAEVPQIDFASERLVGRDTEFSKLRQYYRAAMAGRRQLVFMTGEPGMGKTALCREFLRRTQNIEVPFTAWGQCIEGYGVQEPYFPMLKAIAELCRTEGESIIQVFKAKAPTCIVQFSDLLSREERRDLEFDVRAATSGRMLRELLDALEAVAESKPLIVVLDDLQWVDRATVDVISEFARRHQPARVLLIGTFRPLEAFLNNNPITVLKEELLAHRLCTEISLAGLTESDIDEYLSKLTARGDLRSDLASLLYRRSEGNPLFIVAALEHSFEQGLLIEEDGHLRLTTLLNEFDFDIPRSLRRIIEAQVDHLHIKEQRILEVASVGGSVFSPVVIASATDHTCQEVEDICHDLASRNHIIRATRDTQLANGATLRWYQFVHVLYRDVLYERQSPGRRSSRHRVIGTQLESLYQEYPEEIAAELALHFERASDWDHTVRYLRLAAENSERRYAHREAIALLARALDLVGRISEEQKLDVELQIHERLATIYVASFDRRCVEAYERVFETASAFGLAEMSARALLNLATCLSWEDAEHCLQTTERASRVIATLPDPLTRARMEMSCHFFAVCAGGWNSHEIDQLRQILQKIRHTFDGSILAPQTIQYGIVQWASSEYKESYESIEAGLDALSSAIGEQNPYLSVDYQKAQFYLPRALFFGGEWGKALMALNASLEVADKNGDCFPAQMLRLTRAWIHFHAMDFHEAVAASEPMEDLAGIFGGSYLVRLSRLLSGSAHVALGDHERALAALTKAQDEMNSHAIVLDWCFRLALHAALAELWLSKGDLERAHDEVSSYVTLAWNTEDRTHQAFALEVSARVALEEGSLAAAAGFISRALRVIEEHHVPLAAWHVYATATRLYESTGELGLAQRHRVAASAAVLSLADSLGPRHPLRAIFLSSPLVSVLLDEDRGSASSERSASQGSHALQS